MSITPEMLAAYVDGELGPEERAEVEAAIDADPSLARQLAANSALRAALSAHFEPILEMPVPERLRILLTAPSEERANVVDIAVASVAKVNREHAHLALRRWAVSGAVAASLALGLVIGGKFSTDGSIRSADGKLLASGALDTALSSQLVSEQSGGEAVRILLSFRSGAGHFCRGFNAGVTSGIACREDGNWTLVRTQVTNPVNHSEYRQADSTDADIIAAAQNMASGAAFGPHAERSARDSGWRD